MREVNLVSCSNVEEAESFLLECFNSESRFDIKPSNESFDVLFKAYEALLSKNADNKNKVIALSYWGFECGLNQL